MRSVLLFVFLLILGSQAIGQFPNIKINSDGQSISEPSIIMDPGNPDHLVAGSNLWYYYYSIDGGLNWTQERLESPEYGVWGDPCLIVDTTGTFYYFHLADPPDGNWIDRIVCQKFDIGSGEWNDGTYMGLNGDKAQDKEWAVVDSATNNIYVTWTQFDKYGTSNPDYYSNIMFSKSSDQGETWSEAIQINEISGNCVDSDETTEGAVPAVGPNGEIYVAWSGPEGIVFDRSLDQGETWLDQDIFIDDHPGGWDYDIPGISRCNGLPVTCCDISNSNYSGTIYVNWTDQRNGTDDTDVWLSKSTDGGDTWSTALRVNDDPPGKHQFFSWMTVDQANGDIYIVFYDRRNHEDRNTDVYLAHSSDGGETFQNYMISETPFLPSANVFFGDYTNITAYDHQVHPIWARADGVNMSIWTANIDLTVDIAEAEEVVPFTLVQNYPNPFRETTYFKFKLYEPSTVTLSVYDIYGRLITSLFTREKRPRGKYIETFEASNHNIEPGVYWFALTNGKNLLQRKMILIE